MNLRCVNFMQWHFLKTFTNSRRGFFLFFYGDTVNSSDCMVLNYRVINVL
jgi:hypothetical protein